MIFLIQIAEISTLIGEADRKGGKKTDFISTLANYWFVVGGVDQQCFASLGYNCSVSFSRVNHV